MFDVVVVAEFVFVNFNSKCKYSSSPVSCLLEPLSCNLNGEGLNRNIRDILNQGEQKITVLARSASIFNLGVS